MKTIPDAFTRNGFRHHILHRNGDVLLVQRQHEDVSKPHWEVVRLRVNAERMLEGRLCEEGERYPGPEDWGIYGWTYSDLESAKAKFNSLTK